MPTATPNPRIKRPRHPRGNALVPTVILIGVLTAVGAGLLRRSSQEMDAAGVKRKYDKQVSCAEAAQEYLVSYFRSYAVNVTDIQFNRVVGDTRFVTGHYDRVYVNKGVRAVTVGQGDTQDAVFNIANRSSKGVLSGRVYRTTVVCEDATDPSRAAEVEYVIRFGL